MLSKTEDQWSSLELKALRNSTDHDGVSAVVRNQFCLRLRSLGSGTSEHRGLPKVRSGSKAKTLRKHQRLLKQSNWQYFFIKANSEVNFFHPVEFETTNGLAWPTENFLLTHSDSSGAALKPG